MKRPAALILRPIDRPRGQAPRQADAVGKHTPGRLRHLRERSVAGTHHLAGQGVTTARSLPAPSAASSASPPGAVAAWPARSTPSQAPVSRSTGHTSPAT
jgi:hypothetical protein